MKYFLLCGLLSVATGLWSQDAYWKFLTTRTAYGAKKTGTIEAWSSPKKYRVQVAVPGEIAEVAIVDSVAGRSLIYYTYADEGERSAVLENLSADDIYDDGDRLPGESDEEWYVPEYEEGTDYVFVEEYKDIKGFHCQKVRFMAADQTTTGSGWVALGLHLDFFANEEFETFVFVKGTLLEMEKIVPGGTARLLLSDYTATPVFPKNAFSLTIPAGYTDLTDYRELGK